MDVEVAYFMKRQKMESRFAVISAILLQDQPNIYGIWDGGKFPSMKRRINGSIHTREMLEWRWDLLFAKLGAIKSDTSRSPGVCTMDKGLVERALQVSFAFYYMEMRLYRIACQDDKLFYLKVDVQDRGGVEDMRRHILDGADVHDDFYGYPLLALASETGDAELVKLLVGQGAKIDRVDVGGFTALLRAALWGYPKIVKWLLDHGALLSKSVYSEFSAAAEWGQASVMAELLMSKFGCLPVKLTSMGDRLPCNPHPLHKHSYIALLNQAKTYDQPHVAAILFFHMAARGLMKKSGLKPSRAPDGVKQDAIFIRRALASMSIGKEVLVVRSPQKNRVMMAMARRNIIPEARESVDPFYSPGPGSARVSMASMGYW